MTRFSFVRKNCTIRCAPLLAAGWCCFLFLYGLNSGPLYRTEALRAMIGRESLRGHWLYPQLYGEPFLTKPPGHYVAIGICSLPFGDVNTASARLPSVLAAMLTVVLMYHLFSRTLNGQAALLLAVLLPCSVLWLDKVPSAEIDMTLVGWVTAALVLFFFSWQAQGLWSLSLLIGAMLCVAGGTLTKWTAPAFFYLTVVPFLVWQRRVGFLLGWQHLLAASVAVSMCALWALAVIHQLGWDALVETLRKEAAYRFSPKASKGYPLGEVATYPLIVFAAHLPISAFALVTFRRKCREQLDAPGKLLLQFLHCWTWPNLLFWTLVPNHNIRYTLPLSAGLMGLGVIGLIGWFSSSHKPKVSAAQLVIAFLFCWVVAKVVFVTVVVPGRTAGRDAEATAAELRERVPSGQPLYVFKLKDEGITFYYARPVLRATNPARLPTGAYVLLIRQEWEDRAAFGHLKLVFCMYDQQGDPIYLVRHP